jgi:phage/plasmid-like protein (TIGR03299 family)
MPANVDKMFSVREMPWHREGQVLDDYPQTWEQARVLAGLDWEAESQPVFALVSADEQGQPIYEPVDGFHRITRSDTGATLAIRQTSYEIIPNSAFGEIFEAVLETDRDHLRAETGGVLEGGRKVWMLVSLDEPVTIPGDSSATYPFMAITSRHDALGSTQLRATAVRIVCANTFSAAEAEGDRTGLTFKFVHRGSWRDNIDEARAAVTASRREFKAYTDMMADLAALGITSIQREQFVTAFIPAPPAGTASKQVLANVADAQAKLREILAGPTVDGAGIGGSVYGLVQGAGEYLDHVRMARTWETKLGRTLLKPEPLKAKARTIALDIVGA